VFLGAFLAVAASVGCGSSALSSSQQGLDGNGDERACSAAAAMRGLSLDIDPAFAPKVASATISVCWAGSCSTPTVELFPSTKTVDQGCQGETCSAQAVATGGKFAYIPLPNLPAESVQVTLEMLDASGKALSTQNISAVPTLVHPNGPECGGEAPQLNLVVAADGSLHVR